MISFLRISPYYLKIMIKSFINDPLKISDISSIDSEQQPKIDHQYKIDNYRSTLYFLFNGINSHAIRKEYDEGLDVIMTVRSLLKRDLFSQLGEHERSNMRD